MGNKLLAENINLMHDLTDREAGGLLFFFLGVIDAASKRQMTDRDELFSTIIERASEVIRNRTG